MKTKLFLKIAKSGICLLLSFACLSFIACADKAAETVKDPILESEEGAVSVSFYEFLLSRMRGTLARNKYDVKDPAFWASETQNGMTYEEYYNKSILDSCKNYLAAAILFDKEGLKLPQSVIDSIDEEINFYIEYDGGKDENKFNMLIEKYGVDAKSLREAYIIEAKYEHLMAYLYGGGNQIGDALKEEYYEKNYIRFKQILFPKFYYEYERDEQGNLMYFDPENGKPLYDTKNGTYIYDADGNHVRDQYGVTIYYDRDGKILYDKEKGQPSVKLDENGEGIKYDYSESEILKKKQEAEALIASLQAGNISAFEAEQSKHINVEGSEDAYPDGYYLSRLDGSGYDGYLIELLEALEEMEEGEIRLVETDHGYHLIMKYELDKGKYKDGEYAEWFVNFESSLMNKLFLDRCGDIVNSITVNQENLAKARSIARIGTNFDY